MLIVQLLKRLRSAARPVAAAVHRLRFASECTICLPILVSVAFGAQQGYTSAVPHQTTPVVATPLNAAHIRMPIADGKDIQFSPPNTAGGLSQTKAGQITQDDQGFIWFGTQYGLDRFDGYSYKVFVHDPLNPASLSGVFVESLFKDRAGTIWVGCEGFLNRFNRTTETFTRFRVPTVYHISQDKRGMLWLATAEGLYQFDPVTGQSQRYLHDAGDPSSLSSNDIKSTGEDRRGGFWVGSKEGLDKFDQRSGRVTLHIPLQAPGLGSSFFEDRFGLFWIFHDHSNALQVLDRDSNILTQYVLYDPKSPGPVFAGVRAMLEDGNGALWFATNGAGLLRLDREHRRFIRYRHSSSDPYSLFQDSVISLFRDRENLMWAGLGGMGATHFATRTLPFKKYRRDFGDPTSNGEPFVGAIYEDHRGTLWFGSHEGLSRIEHHGSENPQYRSLSPRGCEDVITIKEDDLGRLWVGTYGHGLYRFDWRSGTVKVFKHNPNDPKSLSSDIVTRLLVDHRHTVWAATSDGLDAFQPSSEDFVVYKNDADRGKPFYLELVEDSTGALWLGTDAAGLQRFDPGTGRFTSFQQIPNVAGTLSDNRVNSVHFDGNATMWVGTQDGLDRFSATTGRFDVYTMRDGLPGNAVGCILEDAQQNLWMSTNNGVAEFMPQSNQFRSYSVADGLPGPDLTGWGACAKSASGQMLFGGFSGATAFYPRSIIEDHGYTPPVVLTEFTSFGAGPPLQRSVTYAKAITLPHKENVFSIRFAALSFENPSTNRYRYKLDGLDTGWHEVESDQRIASYSTLPSGTYTFRLQGATSRGSWGEPGVRLSVKILPPWWLSWWFTTACAAALLVVVVSAYRVRVRQIALQFSLRLEERVSERTRLARELHDTFLQTILASKIVADTACDGVTNAADMHLALTKVSGWLEQAVGEGRAALDSLRGSTLQVCGLTESIRRGVEDVVARSSLGIEFEVIGTEKALHPALYEELYRIACEGVRNACLHSEGNYVRVELHYMEDFVLCIKDNGKGINPAIVEVGRQAHFGLRGMKERAERVGGRLRIVTSASTGTAITIRVPGAISYCSANMKHL